MRRPAVRGRYMKTFLDAVDRASAEDAAAIRAHGAQWIEAIDSAGAMEWLPVEANLDLTRSVASVLGPKRTHDFFEELTLASFQTPLMRGLVSAVVAFVGHDPGRYIDWMQKGFGMLFRDAGKWTVIERTDTVATLQVEDLPKACFEDAVWIDSVASSCHALFRLANCEGAASVRTRDPERSRVVFRMMWSKPA